MANNSELNRFVERSLEKGLTKDAIRVVLSSAKWESKDIDRSLSSYADIEFPLAVPAPKFSLAARGTVFYLFLFTLLYVVSVGFIFLAFYIIELSFPIPTDYSTPESLQGSIRYWVSWCLVFTPAYLFTSWRSILQDRSNPSGIVSAGRQWLTYLTIFVAAVTGLSDFVVLIYGVLDGELTTRFFLKIAVVAVLSSSIICYYLYDIKRAENSVGVNCES